MGLAGSGRFLTFLRSAQNRIWITNSSKLYELLHFTILQKEKELQLRESKSKQFRIFRTSNFEQTVKLAPSHARDQDEKKIISTVASVFAPRLLFIRSRGGRIPTKPTKIGGPACWYDQNSNGFWSHNAAQQGRFASSVWMNR